MYATLGNFDATMYTEHPLQEKEMSQTVSKCRDFIVTFTMLSGKKLEYHAVAESRMDARRIALERHYWFCRANYIEIDYIKSEVR